MAMPNFKTMSTNDIKKFYGIGEDIPLDLVKLCSKMDISVLPKNLAAIKPNNCFLCAFVTNDDGRSAVFYDEGIMDREFSEFPVIVQALIHHMLTDEKNFVITPSAKFSDRERRVVFEFMMPENQVQDVLEKLLMPTTYNLSKIFRVPQKFVKQRLDTITTNRSIGNYHY